ncbi:putative phage tail assembly chaperone [Candidatus Thiothrix sp. Deng01]|uniref:Phage tail assembly chaperone n=1 Tax=Candidatus Thiothrix phosphatis TaxID=3112415 RepID=A0ABU6D3U4_9GAMM|nr:putative phage tail assembly chaperone [Candidatus Thiothrix sp. Deng01]MEB4592983.1 putative phage tail assembly chaperone [Candidatus Thiothrix sp. Deng01]
MQKDITLELANTENGDLHEFSFTVTSDAYHRLQNALMGKDKVAPLHNFTLACADASQKQDFIAYLSANEGMAGQVAGALLEEFLPKVEISVKKPKDGQTTPAATV